MHAASQDVTVHHTQQREDPVGPSGTFAPEIFATEAVSPQTAIKVHVKHHVYETIDVCATTDSEVLCPARELIRHLEVLNAREIYPMLNKHID